MNTNDEKSLTRAADPASVFIAGTLDTSTGSVALDGLRKDVVLLARYNPLPQDSNPIQSAAEELTVPPVAGGEDSNPTNWFEFGASLCLDGRISETRLRRAFDRVREAVDRA